MLAHASEPRPLRALLHPLWWAALALLVLNDHVLKGAGLLSGEITGKLSDFAGMLVAPAVLAAGLGVRTWGAWRAAHLAVGGVFAAINLWPAAARGFEALMALTPWPWLITVDPTDLVALPLLAVSWRVLGRFAAAPVPVGAVLARAGLAVGAWACVATSPPPEPFPEGLDGGFPTDPWLEAGNLVVVNQLAGPQVVRVRTLRADVQLDCAALLAAPGASLDAAFFEPAVAWRIEAGRGLVLADLGRHVGCAVWRLDGPGLALSDAIIDTADFGPVELDTDNAAGSVRALRIGAVGWLPAPMLFTVADSAPGLPGPAACQQPESGAGVSWLQPEAVRVRVAALSVGPDGCHRFQSATAASADRSEPTPDGRPWYLCTGGVRLPFAVGDRLEIGNHWRTQGNDLVVTGAQHQVSLAVGWSLSTDDAGFEVAALPPGTRSTPDPDCPAQVDPCGARIQPLLLEAPGRTSWRAGQTLETADGEITMVRADRTVAWDPACDPARLGFDQVEWVRVRRVDRPDLLLPEPEPGPEPDPESDAGPEPDPESDAGPEPDPEADAGPEPDPESDAGPEPDASEEP